MLIPTAISLHGAEPLLLAGSLIALALGLCLLFRV
jgi:hypothetical protein